MLNSTVTLWQLKLTKNIKNLNERSSLKDLWSCFFSASLQNIILIKVEGEQFHVQETEKLFILKDTYKVPRPLHTEAENLPTEIAPCTIKTKQQIFTVSQGGFQLGFALYHSCVFNITNALQKTSPSPQMDGGHLNRRWTFKLSF